MVCIVFEAKLATKDRQKLYTPYIMPKQLLPPAEVERLREEADRRGAEFRELMARPETQAELDNLDRRPPWEREDWIPPMHGPEEPEGVVLARMRALLPQVSAYFTTVPIGRKRVIPSMKKLKAARAKMLKLADVVRDEAFTWWLEEHVVDAEQPDKWTQSTELYKNYLKWAKYYGDSQTDQRLIKAELATVTRWGKMMGSLYPNKRRTSVGWFYPVRLKRGA